MKNTNISKKIIKWYDNNKRILPWRAKISNKKKEYFTLVSEFMLQQTQVKTVVPYFNNFILKIPDLESLSKIRNEKLNVAEIGINKNDGMKMYRDYFKNADMYGFELKSELIDNAKKDNLHNTILDAMFSNHPLNFRLDH